MQMVSVEVDIRNETGTIIYQDSVNSGETDDGGRTIRFPIGYLPNIKISLPGDVRVIFFDLGTDITGASFIDRFDDVDAKTSTITLALPGGV